MNKHLPISATEIAAKALNKYHHPLWKRMSEEYFKAYEQKKKEIERLRRELSFDDIKHYEN